MLPPAQIVDEYRQRRKRQWMFFFPFVISILLVMIFGDRSRFLGMPAAWLTWIALALGVAYGLASYFNWRCPACDRYLGKHVNPTFCPKCGTRLKEAA